MEANIISNTTSHLQELCNRVLAITGRVRSLANAALGEQPPSSTGGPQPANPVENTTRAILQELDGKITDLERQVSRFYPQDGASAVVSR